MTDQKRDEPVPRLPPLQSDPARRIRRIQRWLGGSYTLIPVARLIHPRALDCDRWNISDQLFSAELAWLCSYAETLPTNIPGMSALVDRYTAEYKAREAELASAQQTIAEQKARIEELEGRIANALI